MQPEHITKKYFTRDEYLSRKHNSKGSFKAIKNSKLNIISHISEGLISCNGIDRLQHYNFQNNTHEYR